MRRTWCLLIVLMICSVNVCAQNERDMDEQSLSKKELRKLHREQRKEERQAKRNHEDEQETEQSLQREGDLTTVDSVDELDVDRIEMEVEKELSSRETAKATEQNSPTSIASESESGSDFTKKEAEQPNTSDGESDGTSVLVYLIVFAVILAGMFFGKSSGKDTGSGSKASAQKPEKIPVVSQGKAPAMIADIKIRNNGYLETIDEKGKVIGGRFLFSNETFIGFTQSAYITITAKGFLTTFTSDSKEIKGMFLPTGYEFRSCAGNTFTIMNKRNYIETYDMHCKRLNGRYA